MRLSYKMILFLILGFSSYGHSFGDLGELKFWNSFSQSFRLQMNQDYIGFFGKGDGAYAQILSPCQEVVENSFASVEMLQEQLLDACQKDYSLELAKRRLKVEIQDFCQPFRLHALYDWVFCLAEPSGLYENSDIFLDNITKHALKGVIVFSPQNPDRIRDELAIRGFELDPQLQEIFCQRTKNNKYRNLMVFRNRNPKIFYLSYIKSGSTWALHALRRITGMPAAFFSNTTQQNLFRPSIGASDDHSEYLMKIHAPSFVKNQTQNPQSDKLIIIVRNYFEAMISAYKSVDAVYHQLSAPMQSYYFDILQLYDSWNPENRLLVYYEDYMTDFVHEMKRMLDFLEVGDEGLQPFMEDYETYSQDHLIKYTAISGPGSGGGDLLFHSRNVPESQLTEMETIVRNRFPDLWNKYLSRYAVEDRDL